MIHPCVSHPPPGNEVFYGKNFTIVSISPGASDWFCGYKVQNYSFCGACVSLWENSEKGGGEELQLMNGLGNNLRNHLKHFMHKGGGSNCNDIHSHVCSCAFTSYTD